MEHLAESRHDPQFAPYGYTRFKSMSTSMSTPNINTVRLLLANYLARTGPEPQEVDPDPFLDPMWWIG